MAKETLTIDFKASGDKELINAFKGIANAQKVITITAKKQIEANKELNGQNTKLNAATIGLTAKLGAQNKTWKDIGVKTKVVSEAFKGNLIAIEKLKNAYKKTTTVSKKVTKTLSKLKGQNTKLNGSVVRLTAKLTAQGKTWKSLGVSTKQVSLAFRGNQVAIAQLGAAYKKTTTSSRILGGSFSVLRSKLLIYSFGVGLASKAILDQVNAFAVQEASVEKLATVFGSDGANALNEYSSELQNITTFGDEVTNSAMATIGMYGASIETTKQLTKGTMDLAIAMDMDLITAAQLVAKTIGSSTNALSRYGVQIDATASQEEKATQATAEMQRIFGGLAEAMANTTEGQLKQAQNAFGDFQEVLGSVLTPIVLKLAQGLKTIAIALQNPFILGAATTFGLLAFASISATSAFSAQSIALGILTAAQTTFNIVAKANPYILAASVLLGAATAITAYAQSTSEGTKKTKENNQSVIESIEAQKELDELIDKSTSKLSERLALLDAEIKKGSELTELEKVQITSKRRLTKEEIKGYQAIEIANQILLDKEQRLKDTIKAEKEIAKEQERIRKEREKADQQAVAIEEKKKQGIINSQQSLRRESKLIALKLKLDRELTTEEQLRFDLKRNLTEQEIAYAKSIDLGNEQLQARIDKEKTLEESEKVKEQFTQDFTQKILDLSANRIEAAQAEADALIAISQRQQDQELASLRATRRFQQAHDKKKAAAEKEIIDRHQKQEAEVRKKANAEMVKMFRIKQAVDIAGTIISTQRAYMETLALTGGFFGIPLAKIVLAQGAAAVGMIASQKPPKMRYGGAVGGNRHSQGGTMIEAERGEFVMRREAVDSIGLETMNRINSGKGGGSVNINMSGNVLSKDFIEDEAIPQIKEALRRGGDIGIG